MLDMTGVKQGELVQQDKDTGMEGKLRCTQTVVIVKSNISAKQMARIPPFMFRTIQLWIAVLPLNLLLDTRLSRTAPQKRIAPR